MALGERLSDGWCLGWPHDRRTPRLVGRTSDKVGSLVLDPLGVVISAIDEQVHPGSGITLATLAQEQLRITEGNRGVVRWVTPLPTFLEIQHFDVEVQRSIKIRHRKDRYRERVLTMVFDTQNVSPDSGSETIIITAIRADPAYSSANRDARSPTPLPSPADRARNGERQGVPKARFSRQRIHRRQTHDVSLPKGSDALVHNVINGIADETGEYRMPPRGGNSRLTDQQIRLAVGYKIAVIEALRRR